MTGATNLFAAEEEGIITLGSPIYFATRFRRYRKVREYCQRLRDAGYHITHDWTLTSEFDENGNLRSTTGLNVDDAMYRAQKRMYAQFDLDGVKRADLIILWDDPKILGAAFEVGAALALNKKVWVCDKQRESVFYELPNVREFDSVESALSELGA